MDYTKNAEIKQGSWFATLEQPYIVLRSEKDLEQYIQYVVAGQHSDIARVPDSYWKSLESQVRESYKKFDKKFFETKDLIIAMVDQGSSRVTYEVVNYTIYEGLLTINIKKDMPMILTMDFVSTVIYLAMDKDAYVKMVHVSVT